MYNNPLEQFEIFTILNFWNLDLYTINSLIIYTFLLIVIKFWLLFRKMRKRKKLNRFSFLCIKIFNILFFEAIGGKKIINYFFVFPMFIFYYIAFMNMLGMIPYSFTITSHLIVTFQASFFFFLGLNILGFLIHGFRLLTLFIVSGIPKVIKPFLTVIELISYLARVFSLSIRLFANVMAGHTLLAILTDFVWAMVVATGLASLGTIVPVIIIIAVTTLELAICFLQAYVFVLLLTIYIRDVVFLH